MGKAAIIASLLGVLGGAGAPAPLARPQILGIGRVVILTNGDAGSFYGGELGFESKTSMRNDGGGVSLEVNPHQRMDLIPAREPKLAGLEQIDFEVSNASGMRAYLAERGFTPGELRDGAEGGREFTMKDPDGHKIGFVEYVKLPQRSPRASGVSERLIHAGFVVHNRAAEDRFYKDVLGFKLYWHGGMKDKDTDWVDMQAPNGTDWLEYMLNVSPAADRRGLGVMNHIALGVNDIHAAERKLLANGAKLREKPEIGRDGKWQLNLYDAAGTRIEFMEFAPVRNPCCAPYAGPHPRP